MKYEVKEIINSELQIVSESSIYVSIKREDLIHPEISGNKYRKLKYNILEAKKQQKRVILTFGGAYSNHIAAVASVGNKFDFETVGIIRGEELESKAEDNPTLAFAKANGMYLKFVSRELYRQKESSDFIEELKDEFGDFYQISEGGTNTLAIKGCEEILNDDDTMYDYICCAVGTGGTISGLINSAKSHQKILGFPALKGNFLKDEISKFANQNNWKLINDYHFGGYAKINTELIAFLNTFKKKYSIPLDPIYTGKMMFGIFDLMQQNYFEKGSKILAIHTGGLQGIKGMNITLRRKGIPLIDE